MQTIDTLIHARWIIPVEPAATVLHDHAVAIDNGRIAAIVPSLNANAQFEARQTLQLPQHALIPGFVNAHTHTPMSLFRGMADDMPLNDWLTQKIWPAEGRWVNDAFVQDGSLLAIAEMLRGGTTCFADMYFYPETVAKVARKTGIRACVGLIVLDFPSVWASDATDYIRKGTALHDELANEALLSTVFAPHAPYTVSDDPLRRVAVLANELDIPVMCHVHETAHEVDEAFKSSGSRPLARLDRLGLLSPALNAVHMTQLLDEEIARLAECGAHVIHCPESNLKLASGFCPVDKLLSAGVNVALGTDGAASNNDLDMLGELRSAALLAKAVAGNAAAVPAFSALKMATLNGAIALGLAGETGSLLPGKAADIVAIDLGALKTQPVYDPVSQIVYAADSSQVSDVWVAGRQLLKNRELTTIDSDELLEKSAAWRDKIAS